MGIHFTKKDKYAVHNLLSNKRINTYEGFAGGLPKSKRKSFDKMRRKQSEVLGYKLTGISDLKTEIDDATITEGLYLMSEVADDK